MAPLLGSQPPTLAEEGTLRLTLEDMAPCLGRQPPTLAKEVRSEKCFHMTVVWDRVCKASSCKWS
eukprot:860899-Ditylum_brightwellii.AAC.1